MPAAARDLFVADIIAAMRKHHAQLIEHPNPLHPELMTYRFDFEKEGRHERLGLGRLYDALRIFGLATIERTPPA